MPRQLATRVLSTYELTEKFPNEQSAIDYLAGILWKDGVVCETQSCALRVRAGGGGWVK